MIEQIKRVLYACPALKAQIKDNAILDYGREIITLWAKRLTAQAPESTEWPVLDIGCGKGDDLLSVRAAVAPRTVHLDGLDCFPTQLAFLKERGISGHVVDIEHERFPFPDQRFDVIICNQILEHTKEIFWILSECARVLRRGGHVIIGVPNLAALHNRLLLLFGDQPPCIHVLGPHVRAFTKKGLQRFLETDGIFRVVDFRGSNLYPFPPAISRPLVRWFPGLAAGIFLLAQRTDSDRTFLDVLKSLTLETNYFQGS